MQHVFTGAHTPTANERLGDFTADTFTVYTPGTTRPRWTGTNTSPNCQVATLELHPAGAAGHDHRQPRQRKQHDRLFHPAAQWRPQSGEGRRSILGSVPHPGPRKTNTWASMTRTSAQRTMWQRLTSFRGTCSDNSPGGNVPWTINQFASNGTNVNLSDVHTFSPNHSQPDLAHVHAGSGRTRQPAGHRPGVANPRIVRLELSHPGTTLVAQLSPRPISLRPRPMRVRSRVLTTMNCATWSA